MPCIFSCLISTAHTTWAVERNGERRREKKKKKEKTCRNTKLQKRKKKNELNRPPTDDNENYLFLFFLLSRLWRIFSFFCSSLISILSLSRSRFWFLLYLLFDRVPLTTWSFVYFFLHLNSLARHAACMHIHLFIHRESFSPGIGCRAVAKRKCRVRFSRPRWRLNVEHLSINFVRFI